jgi:DNA-binding response OmpR family regulator
MGCLRSALEGKRILIVEEEFLVGEDLRQMVEQAGATPVGPALTTESALHLADNEKIDAALLDIHLSDEEASECVARTLTSNEVPFIVMSGYTLESVRGLMQRAPFMDKPVRSDMLLDALEVIIHPRAITAAR